MAESENESTLFELEGNEANLREVSSRSASKSFSVDRGLGKIGKTISNSLSSPDVLEEFKESSGISYLSSPSGSSVFSRSCITQLSESDFILEENSSSRESENSLYDTSSGSNLAASSPLSDHLDSFGEKQKRNISPVLKKCPYSRRRDFCRENCHYKHEAVLNGPSYILSQNQGFDVSGKVKLDFTHSTLQQRKHLCNWPTSPYLMLLASYQLMIGTSLSSPSSRRSQGPVTSNGLLDVDAAYPCSVFHPCIIDMYILAEVTKARCLGDQLIVEAAILKPLRDLEK